MARLGFCECCGGKVSDEAQTCPHYGQSAPYSPDSVVLASEVSTHLHRRSKIGAIRLIRKELRIRLRASKDLFDEMCLNSLSIHQITSGHP